MPIKRYSRKTFGTTPPLGIRRVKSALFQFVHLGSVVCILSKGELTLFRLGSFWSQKKGLGHIMPPPPLFLLYLWSNYNQTWHVGTLGQNLSKAIKSLLTSSLGGTYNVIKPFLVLFQVKIRVPLSFVQWS